MFTLPVVFWQDRARDTGSCSRSDLVHFNQAVHPDSVGRLHRLRTTRPLETDSGFEEEPFMMTYRQVYVRTVLNLYIQMPDTPPRPTLRDRVVADRFFDRQIPIDIVEAALLLGSSRRIFGCLAPAPICSLAYFESIIKQLLDQPSVLDESAVMHFKFGHTSGVDPDDGWEPPF